MSDLADWICLAPAGQSVHVIEADVDAPIVLPPAVIPQWAAYQKAARVMDEAGLPIPPVPAALAQWLGGAGQTGSGTHVDDPWAQTGPGTHLGELDADVAAELELEGTVVDALRTDGKVQRELLRTFYSPPEAAGHGCKCGRHYPTAEALAVHRARCGDTRRGAGRLVESSAARIPPAAGI